MAVKIEREWTVEEALEIAASPRQQNGMRNSSRSNDSTWSGSTFDEAVKMGRHGYASGTARLKRRLQTMQPNLRQSMRPKPVWGVSGSDVDMGRYLAGEPDNMVESVRQRRQSLVLRIGVERTVSSYVSASDIEAVGASVLAVVERLRTSGIPSEVWVTFTHENKRGDAWQARVKVQDAGRPIDMDRLAFWCMHPAALRRIGFALAEKESPDTRRVYGFGPGNYSYPTTISEPEWRALGFDEFAPSMAEEVEEWVSDVLNRRTTR
jgi:hypothetical protein